MAQNPLSQLTHHSGIKPTSHKSKKKKNLPLTEGIVGALRKKNPVFNELIKLKVSDILCSIHYFLIYF